MIDINRSLQRNGESSESIAIKIIGIGGAGSNAIDRMILDETEHSDIVVINTDLQSLNCSVASEKIQIGNATTRGLGAGGDPEVGAAAAEESSEEIRAAVEGAAMIFVCAGLGGGTGSGVAPLVASLAKEQGALVIAFTTMPFAFEGKRRRKQAEEALAALEQMADAVICFENDKMGETVSPKAGINQAFANADAMLSQSVRAIGNIFAHRGLIDISFADLGAALRSSASNAMCLFGFGEADGDNRAHDALARALKNPLMDRGKMLAEAHHVLVNISGGPDMTLNDVQILMEELNRHIDDDACVRFGATVDLKASGRMSVTIISSTGSSEIAEVEIPSRESARATQVEPEIVAVEPEITQEPTEHEDSALPGIADQEPEPVVTRGPIPRPHPMATKPLKPGVPISAPMAAAKKQEHQETLQFEPIARGRFEKSEPTIVDGQDLDVPTFLRRNVKVK